MATKTSTTRLRVGTFYQEVKSLAVKQSTYHVTLWLVRGWPRRRPLPLAGQCLAVVNRAGQSVLSLTVHRSWRTRGLVHVEGRRLLCSE